MKISLQQQIFINIVMILLCVKAWLFWMEPVEKVVEVILMNPQILRESIDTSVTIYGFPS